MRFFTTEGPVNCQDHYCLPPLARLDLEDVMALIAQKKYFLLHAPRQTGKTTCLLALADLPEPDRTVPRRLRQHRGGAGLARECGTGHGDGHHRHCGLGARLLARDVDAEPLVRRGAGYDRTRVMLWASSCRAGASSWTSRWCCMLDEVDALVGDTLISLLRQLRAGYPKRPGQFPQTVILCGVRDLQDYRIQSSSEKTAITGGSAFNIKAKSLRLGDFNQEETVSAAAGAHRRDGPGLHPGGAGPGVAAHQRPALAGQRPGL